MTSVLEKEAQKIVDENPDLKLKFETLTSIHGVGSKTAVMILSEMPDVSNFQNASQYVEFAGVTSSHFQQLKRTKRHRIFTVLCDYAGIDLAGLMSRHFHFRERIDSYEIYDFYKNRYYRNGQTTLHRFKYEEKFGTVFSCFHLRHKDGNKFNNNINNLMLLTVQEHIAMHKAMRRERIFKDQLVLNFSF